MRSRNRAGQAFTYQPKHVLQPAGDYPQYYGRHARFFHDSKKGATDLPVTPFFIHEVDSKEAISRLAKMKKSQCNSTLYDFRIKRNAESTPFEPASSFAPP